MSTGIFFCKGIGQNARKSQTEAAKQRTAGTAESVTCRGEFTRKSINRDTCAMLASLARIIRKFKYEDKNKKNKEKINLKILKKEVDKSEWFGYTKLNKTKEEKNKKRKQKIFQIKEKEDGPKYN